MQRNCQNRGRLNKLDELKVQSSVLSHIGNSESEKSQQKEGVSEEIIKNQTGKISSLAEGFKANTAGVESGGWKESISVSEHILRDIVVVDRF